MNVRSEKKSPLHFQYFIGCDIIWLFFFCVGNGEYHFWHICFTVKMYLAYKDKKPGFDYGFKKCCIVKFTFFRKSRCSIGICLEHLKSSCHVNLGDLREIHLIILGENIPFCVSS